MSLSVSLRKFRPARTLRTRLPFPGAARLPIAQVTAAACFDSVEFFPGERWKELEAYQPRVLVGSAADLMRLATQLELGFWNLTTVDHTVFVLTVCGTTPVDDFFRNRIWETFGVPVYELFLGPHGSLLASECEAHEGWHIEAGAELSLWKGRLLLNLPNERRVQTGLAGRIETARCPCGRTDARLMNLSAVGSLQSQPDLANHDLVLVRRRAS
jgi:hypothetical protein